MVQVVTTIATLLVLSIILGAGAQLYNIGDLKLNGEGCTSTGGRVEIFMMSQGQLQWGTISAVNFTKSAADVACHQLGYSGALTFDFAANTSYKVGSGTVWLSGPNCTGNELHILRCQWTDSPCTSCAHRYDVAVQCSSTSIWDNPYEGSVRLYGGNIISMGEVMVYLRGLWGAVCADNFTDAAADSVCRQLGYTVSNDHYQEGTSGDMWLKTLHCNSAQPCFTDCYDYPENSSWITDCSSQPISVSCEYDSSNVTTAGTDCQFVLNVSSSATPTATPSELLTVSQITQLTPATSTTPLPSSTTPTLSPSHLPLGSETPTLTLVLSSASVLVLVVAILVIITCFVVQRKRAHGRQRYSRLPRIMTRGEVDL